MCQLAVELDAVLNILCVHILLSSIISSQFCISVSNSPLRFVADYCYDNNQISYLFTPGLQ